MKVFDKMNKIVFFKDDNYKLKDNEEELKSTGWTDKLGQPVYERDVIINSLGYDLIVHYNNYHNSFDAIKDGYGDGYITEKYINNSTVIGLYTE